MNRQKQATKSTQIGGSWLFSPYISTVSNRPTRPTSIKRHPVHCDKPRLVRKQQQFIDSLHHINQNALAMNMKHITIFATIALSFSGALTLFAQESE
ncbi:MAG: hypothetical protein AB7H80_17285, partial [Candidatus Kapaibacterium sp.]